MLLQKINSKYFLIIFLILTNFWIYKILSQNLLIGILLIILTLIIILSSKRKITFVCIALLSLLQLQTTSVKNLTLLDNDQQRVQSERKRSYPPVYFDLGLKVIWLKPADWIERNNLIIGLSTVENNLFSNLDINKYFFGAYPRNKPDDFEKFPFMLLPLFIAGIFVYVKKKKFSEMGLLFLGPIVLLAFLGNDNKFGPFLLFPFFIISFIEGLNLLESKFKKTKVLCLLFCAFVILGFILQISYGKF